MRLRGAIIAGLALVVTALVGPAPAAAQGEPSCVGEIESEGVPQKPGPNLRFGIGPLVQAGQIGPLPGPAVAEQPDRTHEALARLRPSTGAFVLRLNRFFWSDGEAGIQRYLDLARRFTDRGYEVELQVRYHPSPEQEGDIAGWVRHVREVVRRFGANPGVVALQIANEVNLTISEDSSDGAYEGAREALVQGVIAGKDEARRLGHDRLEIGFNWAYRTDPASEESFWRSLRDRGGAEFVRSLDWIGLDAYPGTVFPPAESDLDGYRDGMVNAMSAMRCFAAIPGIPETVPMKVEENGWPTFGARSHAMQADVLRTMVGAVHDFRGTFNVTDYRWFNLRDGDSSSPQPFQHFGLLDSAYNEKPAFAVYDSLVDRLHRREPATPRLHLRRRCVLGRLRVAVAGKGLDQIKRARFRSAGRRSVDRSRPFAKRVRPGRVRVGVRLKDGSLIRLRQRLKACPSD